MTSIARESAEHTYEGENDRTIEPSHERFYGAAGGYNAQLYLQLPTQKFGLSDGVICYFRLDSKYFSGIVDALPRT